MPKRKKITRAIKALPKTCAFPGCDKPVKAGDLCYGCNAYVCGDHAINAELPFGGHDVEAHWASEQADQY